MALAMMGGTATARETMCATAITLLTKEILCSRNSSISIISSSERDATPVGWQLNGETPVLSFQIVLGWENRNKIVLPSFLRRWVIK